VRDPGESSYGQLSFSAAVARCESQHVHILFRFDAVREEVSGSDRPDEACSIENRGGTWCSSVRCPTLSYEQAGASRTRRRHKRAHASTHERSHGERQTQQMRLATMNPVLSRSIRMMVSQVVRVYTRELAQVRDKNRYCLPAESGDAVPQRPYANSPVRR